MRPGRVGTQPLGLRFQNLLLVEEKLLEAKYFIFRMMRCRNRNFYPFDLNAFLSAARSVMLLLRKEMARVPGFSTWWKDTESQMEVDPSMRFFRELRNYSQKEGRVQMVGHGRYIKALKRSRWQNVFVSGTIEVPNELHGVDVVDACRGHLAKLARIVLDCAETFPFHTCPRRTLTLEGISARNIDLADVDVALGFPPGWSDAGAAIPLEERIRLLGEHVDAVDFSAITALARFRFKRSRSVVPNASLEALLAARLRDVFDKHP